MVERAITLQCGGLQMLGILHLPDPGQDARRTGVVIIVGGPQYRVGSHRQFVLMARQLARQGYPVLRFDCVGMGDSDGKHRGFENLGADIDCAISAFFAEVANLEGVTLFGLCDGASAACIRANRDPRIHALILANPWVRTEAGAAETLIRHYYLQRLLKRSFWGKLLSDGFSVSRAVSEFVGVVRRALRKSPQGPAATPGNYIDAMERGLTLFKGNVLLLMSENDLTRQEFDLLCQRSERWRALVVRRNVSRADIVGADHTFSTRGSLDVVTDRVVSWLEMLPTGGAARAASGIRSS
jgi:exosortase A-associated hydrolase 1